MSSEPVAGHLPLRLLTCWTAVLLLHPTASAGPPYRYDLTELGSLGGPDTSAHGLNRHGHVVGESTPGQVGAPRAFLWIDGRMIDLGATSGQSWSAAYAINDNGEVVGFAGSDPAGQRPMLWRNGLGIILDRSQRGTARAINTLGIIVGESGSRAALFSLGLTVDLGTLPGAKGLYFISRYLPPESRACGINDQGQIAGYSNDPSASTQAIRIDGRQITAIFPGAAPRFSYAYGLNARGEIVGEYAPPGVPPTAFLYTNGRVIPLDTDSQGIGSSAKAINNHGLIVGRDNFRAVIWENGIKSDLERLIDPAGATLFLRNFEPEAVNDRGQIAGTALDVYGHHRGFLLTPKPFLRPPESQLAAPGSDVRFSVLASGVPPLAYQWIRDGMPLPGATAPELALPEVSPAAAGRYAVIVRDADGVEKISPEAVLTISPTPFYSFATLAGQAGDRRSVDGNAATARFENPWGIATDRSGHVFVAERSSDSRFLGAIRKIDPAGNVVTLRRTAAADLAFSPDEDLNHFVLPAGLAVDAADNLIVSDMHRPAIRRISPDGKVSVVAGSVGRAGYADGPASTARFSLPGGIALDRGGNIFVADTGNNLIRRIDPEGRVSTVAGTPGAGGSADGPAAAARFDLPLAVTVDDHGNVFVADYGNCTIRQISPAGIVTTLAGLPKISASRDGVGPAARFAGPTGIGIDPRGILLVTDGERRRLPGTYIEPANSSTLRRVLPDGTVSTVGGAAGTPGDKDGTGPFARFNNPYALAIDHSGTVYLADSANYAVRKGTLVRVPAPWATLPEILAGPLSQDAALGSSLELSVRASSEAFAYQWKRNGLPMAGATRSSLSLPAVTSREMGFYSAVVTGESGAVESSIAIITVDAGGTSRLTNLATRGLVTAGSDLTVGFGLRGDPNKSVLVRGIGPALGDLGVEGALSAPRLELIPTHPGAPTLQNEGWGGGTALAGAFSSVGAFALAPDSRDAALLSLLSAGSYTARVSGPAANATGIALVEVYERDSAGHLVNLSARGFAGNGAQALTPGFVITGTQAKTLLLRAIGPGLAQFGVTGALADPQLSLIPLGSNLIVAHNDNWDGATATSAAFARAGAFPLAAGSKDAAVVVRLPPGGYTATISGVGGTTGIVLVEVYDLDP